MNRDERERPYVEAAIEEHNRIHGTAFIVEGRCEEVYHELRGSTRWDWVCRDTVAGTKGAIEVKRLTHRGRHEEARLLYEISGELARELSGIIPGTFYLHLSNADESHLNLRGNNRLRFKHALRELILKLAPTLDVGAGTDMTEALRHELPDVLPRLGRVEFGKMGSDGSHLTPLRGATWMFPTSILEGEQRAELEKSVRQANRQLREAQSLGISETILIVLEVDWSGADLDAIKNTFDTLDTGDHCNIRYAYTYCDNFADKRSVFAIK